MYTCSWSGERVSNFELSGRWTQVFGSPAGTESISALVPIIRPCAHESEHPAEARLICHSPVRGARADIQLPQLILVNCLALALGGAKTAATKLPRLVLKENCPLVQ